MTAIQTEGLKKSFGHVRALDGIDLAVDRGTVFGVLGPNGAGKTTFVRILTTLLHPDAGHATVNGFDVVRDAAALRTTIGLAGQSAAVDEALTGRENLELVGRLYHLPKQEARARAEAILERFDLVDAASRPVRTYSGGMRRRLDLGASLVGRPSILFLDEPTTGLDPRSRLGLWELIEVLVREGTTLLLTTQYLEEVDRLASRIAVIDVGRVIAQGTSDELKARVGGEVLSFRVIDKTLLGAAADAIADVARSRPAIHDGDHTISATLTEGGSHVLLAAVRALDGPGIGVTDLALRRPTLDDVFLSLTGHAAEAAEAPARTRRGGRGR